SFFMAQAHAGCLSGGQVCDTACSVCMFNAPNMKHDPQQDNRHEAARPHTLLPIDEHSDAVPGPDAKEVRHRRTCPPPNLFTTAALFSGFYAIVSAMNVNFSPAAIAIFVAMVLDGLDGRVARLTNTQSAFGAEYDSLSDMVAFGVAPALVAFTWALDGMGK